jgi:hypothetical protein
VELKVLTPYILPGIKQPLDFGGRLIAACDVRPFVAVAVKTTESQILEVAVAAVLPGNNVIYLKREPVVRKRNATLLATAVGPAPYLIHQARCHRGEGEFFCVRR